MANSVHPITLSAIGRYEGERLKRCLHYARPGIPVVYVDSASTDYSVANARSTNAIVIELDTPPLTASIVLREGPAKGFHLLLGKIAETQGAFRFFLGHLRGRKQGAIFYK